MNYPYISDYINALKATQDNFYKLKDLHPILDEDGLPYRIKGETSVIFKMKNVQTGKLYALKCFLAEIEDIDDTYRQIEEELELVNSSFLTPVKYYDHELLVETDDISARYPVLLMDWIDGLTLDKYVKTHLDDEYDLSLLAYQFSRFALWLMSGSFAHGYIVSDNIIVREDGTLVLVDYDTVSSLRDLKENKLENSDNKESSITKYESTRFVDEFSIVSILLSLKAISLQPELYDQYGSEDCIFFSRNKMSISISKVFDILQPLDYDEEFITVFSLFLLRISKKLRDVPSRLFLLKRPQLPQINTFDTKVSEEDLLNSWTDDNGVVYSNDGRKLLKITRSLQTYNIKKGTLIICDNAFNASDFDKKSLKSLILPSSILSIGGAAFAYNEEMSYINIPKHVSYINENNPFVGCDNLHTIKWDAKEYIKEDNLVFDKNHSVLIAFLSYQYLNDIKEYWPLMEYARQCKRVQLGTFERKFSGESFKQLVLTKKDDSQQYVPFGSQLGELTSKEISEQKKDLYIAHTYSDKYSLCRIDEIYKEYEKNIELPKGIKTIAGEALSFKDSLKTIILPNSLENIGRKAFYGCSSIEKLSIPDSVSTIGESAFSRCSSLHSMELSSNIREISRGLFQGCTSLWSINIPQNVTSIETNAFALCSSLHIIVLPSKIERIGRIFVGCDNLKCINVPKGTKAHYDDLIPKWKEYIFEIDNNNVVIGKKTDINNLEYNSSLKRHTLILLMLSPGTSFYHYSDDDKTDLSWKFENNELYSFDDDCMIGAGAFIWIMRKSNNKEDFCWLLDFLNKRNIDLWPIGSFMTAEQIIYDLGRNFPSFKLANNPEKVIASLQWAWLDLNSIIRFIDYCNNSYICILNSVKVVSSLQECTSIEELARLYFSDFNLKV